MQFSVKRISDASQLACIEDSWNRFVRTHCETPFLLSGFVKQFMIYDRSTKWRPLILVISLDDQIAGIAPFLAGKLYGVPWIKFLQWPTFSPELTIDSQYRHCCIGKIIEHLFNTTRYKMIDLNLPVASPNIPVIRDQCKTRHIHLAETVMPEYAHRILRITCEWKAYESQRGSNFRSKFKKMERKFNQMGSFNVVCFKNPNNRSDLLQKILNVEKASWKESWRRQKGDETDPEISLLWKSAECTTTNEPDFGWKIYFLEHGNKEVAYSFVLEYGENAFIAKITYDQRYRRFYPGIYLINTAIRQMFNEGRIRNVDFLTDIAFMDTWTHLKQTRQRVMMGKGMLPAWIETGFTNDCIVELRRRSISLLTKRIPSISSLGLWNVR